MDPVLRSMMLYDEQNPSSSSSDYSGSDYSGSSNDGGFTGTAQGFLDYQEERTQEDRNIDDINHGFFDGVNLMNLTANETIAFDRYIDRYMTRYDHLLRNEGPRGVELIVPEQSQSLDPVTPDDIDNELLTLAFGDTPDVNIGEVLQMLGLEAPNNCQSCNRACSGESCGTCNMLGRKRRSGRKVRRSGPKVQRSIPKVKRSRKLRKRR